MATTGTKLLSLFVALLLWPIVSLWTEKVLAPPVAAWLYGGRFASYYEGVISWGLLAYLYVAALTAFMSANAACHLALSAIQRRRRKRRGRDNGGALAKIVCEECARNAAIRAG